METSFFCCISTTGLYSIRGIKGFKGFKVIRVVRVVRVVRVEKEKFSILFFSILNYFLYIWRLNRLFVRVGVRGA